MSFKLITSGALAVAAALLLGGCGSSSDDAAADPSTTMTHSTMTHHAATTPTEGTDSTTSGGGSGGGMAGMAMVSIKDFMYEGATMVEPGEVVMVTNDDSEAHTLTSDQTDAFTVTVAPGKTATFDAPAKAGKPFHCDFHANMHGTLTVG